MHVKEGGETVKDAYLRSLTSAAGSLNLYVKYLLTEDIGTYARGPIMSQVLTALANQPMSAGQIARAAEVRLTSLPKFLYQLTEMDLVKKEGRTYSLVDRVVADYLLTVLISSIKSTSACMNHKLSKAQTIAYAVVVIVLVSVASIVGYSYFEAFRSSSSLSSGRSATLETELSSLQTRLNELQLEAVCSNSTPVSQGPVGNLTPVLLMQPNTTGSVCVTYKTAWSDDPGEFNNLVSGESFWFPNGTYQFRMWISKNNSVSNAFMITPTPSSIKPSANMSSVTVVYSVAALANSKGFYDSSAPYGYCGSVPMAVGYSASQVNGSDFPPRPPPHSCVAEPFIPISVGVVGINVTYVDIPPSRLYMSADVGSCSETGPGYSGYTPCWTYYRSDAYVFNCATAAATSSGCTVRFGNASVGFDVTVWYPATNHSLPWANCAYDVSNASGKTPRSYVACIPVTSSSFIVAEAPAPLT